MPATTTNLFLLRDLRDGSRTGQLAESDLEALQAVAGWITTFVARPHKDLGRAGPCVPSCPGHWNETSCGPLLSRSPAGASHRLSSSSAVTRDCSCRLNPPAATMSATRSSWLSSPTCQLIVPRASLTTSCSIWPFGRTRTMESCSGRTTKATRGLRFTTPGSGHSNHPCRFCLCGRG